MKVSSGLEKRILWDLFFVKGVVNGQISMQQREVDLAKLLVASTAKNKLMATLEENKFNESEVEFTVEEAALMLTWFDEKKNWAVGDAEGVLGLKKLFGEKEIPNEK